MYSKEAFRTYVETVNHALFPFQLVTGLLTVLFAWLVISRPGPRTDRVLKYWLFLHFAVLGLVNILLVKEPQMKYDFTKAALLCFVIAALFLADVFFKRTRFTAQGSSKWVLLIFTGYVLAVYPFIEWLVTKDAYKVSYYGVFPCPTLIFALALLAAAIPAVDRKVYAVVLLFSLSAGIYGPLRNEVYANLGTGVAGIYCLYRLLANWSKIARPQKDSSGHTTDHLSKSYESV